MDDLIVEFLTETNESLGELDLELVNLEQNPNDTELLSNIFRLMHTIKGTCGFLGLPRLETVAHRAENVLGKFRDGKLEVTPDYVSLIFESIDTIKQIVGEMEETGEEPEGDDSALIAKLDAVYEGRDLPGETGGEESSGGDSASATSETSTESAGTEDAKDTNVVVDEPYIDAETGEPIDFEPVPAPGVDIKTTTAQTDEELQKAADGDAPDVIIDEPYVDAETGEPIDFQPVPAPGVKTETKSSSSAASKPAKKAENKQSQKPAGDNKKDTTKGKKDAVGSGKPLTKQTLRVNVDVLEDLMTMVSELVLTRNQLLQILRTKPDSDFSTPLQNLNHAVSELQEGVMKTRMQPVGNAWSKLPRIVRDIAKDLGKKINLVMEGKDTELDKQVLEMITDPLTHMVRNSGDHGIETPEERIAAGKDETGTIRLNAYHEGGHIVIEISDDGRGLNTERIKEKIIENGLLTPEEVEQTPVHQIHQYIFNAGLSTAEKVTAVSGRGVGMDVVRTNIEKIGGSIELKSEEGKGSTFYIKIPLTLAIVSAMIVETAGEKFAIPQLAVQELVLVSESDKTRIETIKGAPFFRLRDKLLPLVSLQKILKLDPPEKPAAIITENEKREKSDVEEPENPEDIVEKSGQYIVVTNVGTTPLGVIVDQVFDMEEIVVKPVASIFKNIDLFSGNTILGDGSVIMILDPIGIANASGENNSTDSTDNTAGGKIESTQEKTAMLLFSAGEGTQKALPLTVISRLEEVELSDIEHTGEYDVIQYGDKLMPLIPFNSDIVLKGEGKKPIMVFEDENSSMGIVVDEILDVTEEYIDMQLTGASENMVGSVIINGKTTDIVDLGHYLRKASNNWFKQRTGHGDEAFGEEASDSAIRVLLVDDSQFFRNMIEPLLKSAGYVVEVSKDPVEALKRREAGEYFDVIISDIEMPEMNGFEFAQEVNTEGSAWKDVPMIAMTSHATPKDMERGAKSGFLQYIPKFDRDTLLDTLNKTLGMQGEATQQQEKESA